MIFLYGEIIIQTCLLVLVKISPLSKPFSLYIPDYCIIFLVKIIIVKVVILNCDYMLFHRRLLKRPLYFFIIVIIKKTSFYV